MNKINKQEELGWISIKSLGRMVIYKFREEIEPHYWYIVHSLGVLEYCEFKMLDWSKLITTTYFPDIGVVKTKTWNSN